MRLCYNGKSRNNEITMAQLHALSRSRHAGKRWRRYSNYNFAATDTVAPLVLNELPRAQMCYPIAFARGEDGFFPVAVQGLKPKQNLHLLPDGRWRAHYVPAHYRAHPFRLVEPEPGRQVMCVDESAGLVVAGGDGEELFDEAGNPSESLNGVIEFLKQLHANRILTVQACAVMEKLEVLRPWSAESDSSPHPLAGLYHVDEKALRTVSGDQLRELLHCQAMGMIYSHWFSLTHLPALIHLAKTVAKDAELVSAVLADDELSFGDNDTLKFDF